MILTSDDGTQQIDFSIPNDYKKICVNCSGGADSSILLLMTIDYVMKNNPSATVSVSTCANDFKARWNGRKAANVINWIIEKTGFKNFDMHYTYYRPYQEEEHFSEVERAYFKDRRIDLSINGLTCNPIGDELKVEDIHGNIVNISEDALDVRNIENVKEPIWIKIRHHHYYTPFRYVDKKFISSMYRQYDALDLFDLTRSCEAIPTDAQRTDLNFENTPCGECWWCLERKWAFGKF